MSDKRSPVVVGVDGTDGSSAAIRYAALDAQRHGVALLLVHVEPDEVSVAPMFPSIEGGLREVGDRLLHEATATAAAIAPDVTTSELRRTGQRAAALAGESVGARAVVLGHEPRSLIDRVVTGSTAVGVAARADCPVIVVPHDWDPDLRVGRVVVGLKSLTHHSNTLDQAFAEAADRGARLVIMHAWRLPPAYADLVAGRGGVDAWRVSCETAIGDLIARLRLDHPGVDVSVEAVYDQAARTLLHASTEADLLITGRRGHGVPHEFRLGSTVRAVLRQTRCPLMVVPPGPASPTLEGLSLENAGRAQK